MILRAFTILGLITALSGCSIERDVPGFIYPASSVDSNGAFPRLLPIDQLQSQGAKNISDDTATIDALSARVAALRGKSQRSVDASISAARIANLRARRDALLAATF
jgi:hypothetical protein